MCVCKCLYVLVPVPEHVPVDVPGHVSGHVPVHAHVHMPVPVPVHVTAHVTVHRSLRRFRVRGPNRKFKERMGWGARSSVWGAAWGGGAP